LLPGVVLALIIGGLIAAGISVANGAERAPGEWLDDNREYGEAIVGLPDGRTVISTSDNISSRDVEILLTRCLEFLRDGDFDQNVLHHNTVTLQYYPRTLKSDAIDAVEAAQKELARIEKETQLRRDIERALAALRGTK
jgi:hypothetical protein